MWEVVSCSGSSRRKRCLRLATYGITCKTGGKFTSIKEMNGGRVWIMMDRHEYRNDPDVLRRRPELYTIHHAHQHIIFPEPSKMVLCTIEEHDLCHIASLARCRRCSLRAVSHIVQVSDERLTMLCETGKNAIVGTQEDHDQRNRRLYCWSEEPFSEWEHPAGVVSAKTAIQNVKAPLPPVRQERQPSHSFRIKAMGNDDGFQSHTQHITGRKHSRGGECIFERGSQETAIIFFHFPHVQHVQNHAAIPLHISSETKVRANAISCRKVSSCIGMKHHLLIGYVCG